jgi:hypothetical protein
MNCFYYNFVFAFRKRTGKTVMTYVENNEAFVFLINKFEVQ